MARQEETMPLRVVVFTAGPMSLPLVSYLKNTGMLAGVVLAEPRQASRGFALDPQFVAELTRLEATHTLYELEDLARLQALLAQWQANVGLVLSFPKIISEDVLQDFEFGVYNVHASELPKYRGPMPLYWQIREQISNSKITLHRVTTEVDAGEIVLQQDLPIGPHDTLYSLAARVAQQSAQLSQQLLESIDKQQTTLAGHAQEGIASMAPWPQAHDLMVNWQAMTAVQIAALARAGNAAFGAGLLIRRESISLLQATAVEYPAYGTEPGTVLHIGEPEGLIVATKDSAVRLDVLSCAEGVYGGLAFAEQFQVDAGMAFETPLARQH